MVSGYIKLGSLFYLCISERMGTESMKNTITMLLDIDTYQQGFITASSTGSKDEKIICKDL